VEELKKYNIDIHNLADGEYVYNYASDRAFFEEFPQDLIQEGRFDANLVLLKSPTMIRLDFDVKGVVERECDRTLEKYEEAFDTSSRVFLKFGDRDEELTEEIELIQRNTQRINVAKYIYEFIVLALPVKSLLPGLRTEADDDEEDVLVYSGVSEGAEEEESEEIDPRWEVLKNLTKNKK